MLQINTNIGNMQLVINLVPDIIYSIQNADNIIENSMDHRYTPLERIESSYICLVIEKYSSFAKS